MDEIQEKKRKMKEEDDLIRAERERAARDRVEMLDIEKQKMAEMTQTRLAIERLTDRVVAPDRYGELDMRLNNLETKINDTNTEIRSGFANILEMLKK